MGHLRGHIDLYGGPLVGGPPPPGSDKQLHKQHVHFNCVCVCVRLLSSTSSICTSIMCVCVCLAYSSSLQAACAPQLFNCVFSSLRRSRAQSVPAEAHSSREQRLHLTLREHLLHFAGRCVHSLRTG